MTKLRVPNFYVVFLATLFLCAGSIAINGQRNNPYSANPSSRERIDERQVAKIEPVIITVGERRPTAVRQVPKNASTALTDIYKVGIGDVLYINLENAPNANGYYTVRRDGTIDYPLAGADTIVKDKTVDQIEKTLADAITLYSNPQIEIKIREYASHKITVAGMAERVGEKSLEREAMPLYAIRAYAIVDSAATKVLIRRSQLAQVETYDLRNEKTGDILIYPGNSVEFTADGQKAALTTNGYFYIAGEVNSTGQKKYIDGMTLFQAVITSGGAKGNPKKATVRRKNDKGTLNVVEYNLRTIRDGKASDPPLSSGDMIEISN